MKRREASLTVRHFIRLEGKPKRPGALGKQGDRTRFRSASPKKQRLKKGGEVLDIRADNQDEEES